MPVTVDEDIVPDIQSVVFHKCTPAWELAEHTLEVHNLTYLTGGEARYTLNGHTIDLEQGSLLVLPRGTVCKGVTFPERPMQCFSVDFFLRDSKYQEAASPFPLSSLPGRHEDIAHLFHELSSSWLDKQPGYIIKSRGLFLQILHRFLEQVVYKIDSSSVDSRVSRAIRYMTAHYAERISVKMMAKMVGLNPTYFGLLFQQELGITFNRWLIRTRVKNAEDMLLSGDYKVSAVAEACGFTDVSHFYKQFKQLKGYPPSHSLPKKF